ncbi:hypothetical protein G3N55_11395 [Dissulfurirhabdus thermomarina]|uniref:DUF8180 domain-containing protein n=1 Tax=Dissulfurirhabdus thermomarina TaxID=1765737 RepID=A0A6N9TTL9_DISTH|nr:hypothetical protein [Dissulfurirhabdus thermomarina]NDY43443.1 hypothetical protein [Dissulfurirhabdus thermomarina]NMX22708.1 hypothetical protein [Dissulfurirhabdus thermomarina]
MTEIEKLRVLVPHWIAHNREHAAEFARWMEDCKSAGHREVAVALEQALLAAQNVTTELEGVLALLGGPAEGGGDGHPPHPHSHEP